jgi:hypothetical protein
MLNTTANIDPNFSQALTKLDKRGKIKLLEKKHQQLFKADGLNGPPKFIPRMAYYHEGERIVSLYPSELSGGENIYTEFVSKEYYPEDKDRKLYKWIFNADWQTEYKTSDPHPVTGDKRYFIPVDELVDVEEYHRSRKSPDPIDDFDSEPAAGSDVPYADMTLRDYAAIHLQKPCSHKKWLNDIIKSK